MCLVSFVFDCREILYRVVYNDTCFFFFFKFADVPGVNESLCIFCRYVGVKARLLALHCFLNFVSSLFGSKVVNFLLTGY